MNADDPSLYTNETRPTLVDAHFAQLCPSRKDVETTSVNPIWDPNRPAACPSAWRKHWI